MDVLRIEPSPLLHGVVELPAPRTGTPPSALVDSLRVHAGEEVVRWIIKLAHWANQTHDQLTQLAVALKAWAADLAELEGGKLVLLCPAEHWHITTSVQGLPIFSDEAAAVRALAIAAGSGASGTRQAAAAEAPVESNRGRQAVSSRQGDAKPKLTIQQKEVGGGTSVLRLDGPIDTDTVAGFQRTVEQCRTEGRHKFVLDLAAVNYVNSTGLGSLVRVAEELASDGGALGLINVQPRVSSVFDMLGLSTFFQFFDDEATACEAFAGLIGPKLDMQVTIAGLSIAFVPFAPFEDTALGHVVGALTPQAAAGLGKKLEELCTKGWKKLALDVSQVGEASGAGTLAEWAEHLRDQGAVLVLIQARPRVREAFDAAGLGDIAWFFRDLGDARTYLRKGAEVDEPSNVSAMGSRIGGFMPPRPGTIRRRSTGGSGSDAVRANPRPSSSVTAPNDSSGVRAASSGRLAKAPELPDEAAQQGGQSSQAAGEVARMGAAHDTHESSSSQTQTAHSPALGPETPASPHDVRDSASSSRRQAIVERAAERITSERLAAVSPSGKAATAGAPEDVAAKQAPQGKATSASKRTAAKKQKKQQPPSDHPVSSSLAPESSQSARAAQGLRVGITTPRMWRRGVALPLTVSLAAAESTTAAATFDVAPQLPGCLVVPAAQTVMLSAAPVSSTFQVTPLFAGKLPRYHVTIRRLEHEPATSGADAGQWRAHVPLTQDGKTTLRIWPDWLGTVLLPGFALLILLCAYVVEALGPTAETVLGRFSLAMIGAFGTLLVPAVLLVGACVVACVFLMRRRPLRHEHLVTLERVGGAPRSSRG